MPYRNVDMQLGFYLVHSLILVPRLDQFKTRYLQLWLPLDARSGEASRRVWWWCTNIFSAQYSHRPCHKVGQETYLATIFFTEQSVECSWFFLSLAHRLVLPENKHETITMSEDASLKDLYNQIETVTFFSCLFCWFCLTQEDWTWSISIASQMAEYLLRLAGEKIDFMCILR